MFKRLRQFIESIVFAGLQPGAPPQPSGRWRWLGPLKGPLERLLAGQAPSDPLYLSNRSWGQRLRLSLVIAVPCLLLVGGLALALSDVFAPKSAPLREPTAAEITAKLLPDLGKTLNINQYRDAELVEIRVDRAGAPKLAGVLQNDTDRTISVEFIVDLTNDSGSRVGAVAEQVDKVSPRARSSFSFPLRIPDAAFALVREIRTVN